MISRRLKGDEFKLIYYKKKKQKKKQKQKEKETKRKQWNWIEENSLQHR